MSRSKTIMPRLITALAITTAMMSLPVPGRAANVSTHENYLGEYMNTDWVPTLTQGAVGEPTADVQLFLAQTGDYTGPVDGIYGTQSAQAVARFQARSGLDPDGIVGIQTWRKILAKHTDSTL